MIGLRLRTRYALALLILLLATVGSLSVALLAGFSVTADNLREASAKSMDVALLRQYERRADDLSVTLAESLVDAVYFLQIDSIATIVDGLSERADINAIIVFDSGGPLYYSGDIPGVSEEVLGAIQFSRGILAESETFIEYYDQSVASNAPVLLNGEVIGHVLVNLSLAPIQEQIALTRGEQNRLIGDGLKRGLWASVGITLTFGCLGIILAVIMGNRLSRPIDTLSKLARRIGRGNYDIPDDLKGGSEVQDLVQSFHSMASDLRATTVSKAYLDNILHGMLDGLLVVGVDGRIQTVNQATCKLLGYEERELLDQPITAFFHEPALAGQLQTLNQPRESAARRKNGDNLPVLLSVSTLRETALAGGAMVWVFRDITSLKAAQNALVATMRESERANQAKSQFLANMSHELRTPLNAIIGYSEMLADEARDRGEQGTTDDLNRIHLAGRHLLGLINDVLDLSKIEAGKMDLNREEFLVQRVIEDVSATVQPMLDQQGNSLTIDCPADFAPVVSDQTKVRQILYNTLSNAAKFTSNGSIAITVRSEKYRNRDWVSIEVADTGIGMSPDQLEKIFGEFIQADSSTTREFGGTGLGLTISRKVTQMLGGEISAASTPGEGSVFTIRLPAQIAGPAIQAPAPPEAADDLANVSGADSERVLLAIDGNRNELERIAHLLSGWGFRVVSAVQVQEGLRLARALHPMAILLDSDLADADGRSLQERLSADRITSEIPVIALPGSSGESIDQAGLLDRLTALLPSASDKSALVVDDDAATRLLLARSLEKAGWIVTEAKDGQEALEGIQNNLPDLIVLDLMMPVMDGEAFLRALKSNPDTASVPVVVVTAKPITAGERMKLQARAETVIEKGADGWIESVRIMGGVLGQRAGDEHAIRRG